MLSVRLVISSGLQNIWKSQQYSNFGNLSSLRSPQLVGIVQQERRQSVKSTTDHGNWKGIWEVSYWSQVQLNLYCHLFMDAMWYCSRGSGRTRSRKTSRTEALFDEAERFSRRTISVCLSNQGEDDQELPSVIEDTTLAPGEYIMYLSY